MQSLSAPFFFRELPQKAPDLHGIHCIILVSCPGVQKISLSALFLLGSLFFCQSGPHLFAQTQRPGRCQVDSTHPGSAENQPVIPCRKTTPAAAAPPEANSGAPSQRQSLSLVLLLESSRPVLAMQV